MKIAIIGSGVVGRVLASIISEFHDVTIFTIPETYTKERKLVSPQLKNQVVGLEWSFPNFACRHGSMPIWGKLLAVPNKKSLRKFGLDLSSQLLIDNLVKVFEIDTVYGTDTGELDYIASVKEKISHREQVRIISEKVTFLSENSNGVSIMTNESLSERQYDYCFISTGASMVPSREGDSVRLVRPNLIYDKLISISPRSSDEKACHSTRGNIVELKVPIDIPAGYSSTEHKAIFHHILSKNGLIFPGHVMSGYIVQFRQFLRFLVLKILQKNTMLWFTTSVGKNSYPIKIQQNEIHINDSLVEDFSGEVFMPALHSDARLVDGESFENRVFTEHLSTSAEPISYNPVVLRLAKLLDYYYKFCH